MLPAAAITGEPCAGATSGPRQPDAMAMAATRRVQSRVISMLSPPLRAKDARRFTAIQRPFHHRSNRPISHVKSGAAMLYPAATGASGTELVQDEGRAQRG